jgi:UDP-glucuronate 4-epimerase
MKILVSGCCGFIGIHTCIKLLELGHDVIGIDNFNDYYDPQIKYDRYELIKNDIDVINGKIEDEKIYDILPKVDLIIHLAAQAGVRYSLINPQSYINSNILGSFKLIDFAKKCECEKFIYASSASVYGKNKIPWNEDMNLSNPISLYGATKIAFELIADSYFEMFGLKSIGLRFFSAYGPWGRPDLSLWKWTEGILKKEPIKLFNYGKNKRSWTYIDDLITGIIATLTIEGNIEKFNLGSEKLVNIDYSVDCISKYLNIKPIKEYEPIQDGDIVEANPDLTKSRKILNFEPKIEFENGIKKFVDWLREYKKL